MGQYYLIVNLDKKEYIDPLVVGCGVKAREICASDVARLLPFLLRKSDKWGGGDPRDEYKYDGHWAGDRIVMIGDYDSSRLFHKVHEEYKDITLEVVEEFNDFMELQDLFLRIDESYLRLKRMFKELMEKEGK